MLAFFQATQLNLFERFLTQAVSGINSTNITSGMQQVAYVVLLVGFMWQVYQSALHGGDVRGLGTNLIKYVVTAVGFAYPVCQHLDLSRLTRSVDALKCNKSAFAQYHVPPEPVHYRFEWRHLGGRNLARTVRPKMARCLFTDTR